MERGVQNETRESCSVTKQRGGGGVPEKKQSGARGEARGSKMH